MTDGAKTILVVEDEALIRVVTVEALTDAGFAVKEAENADEALAVLHLSGNEIDLIFTDVHMPGSMSGTELAHHVRGVWPAIALLVTSGRPQPSLRNLPPGSRFMSKPYDLDKVVDEVSDLVATG
jgi:CheY-like chemotaxis protein